jgi:DNA-binding MarR family transcriptional regulator
MSADSVENKPLGPVLDFMRLMWAINHRLDRTSRHMYTQYGVTGPQRLVIRVVNAHPGLSAGDLARTLHVHPSTLTGILQRLETRGLLRRAVDPDDARRVRLMLTGKGQRLTVPAIGSVESAMKRALAKWSDTERENARRALSAIAEALADHMPAERDTRRVRELRRETHARVR